MRRCRGAGGPAEARNLIVLLCCIVSLGAVARAAGLVRNRAKEYDSISLRSVALHRLDGSTVDALDLIDGHARTVLIVFSPDCQSCVAEAAIWEEIARQLGASGLVIGAAYTADSALIDGLRRDAGITFPLYQIDRDAIRELQADPMPSIFIIARSGRVLFRASGPMSTDAAAKWMRG